MKVPTMHGVEWRVLLSEDPETEDVDYRPAAPRTRKRHSRAEVRARAETRRYKARDNRRARYHDYPWWSKRDRDHGIRLQKGNRP